MAGSAIWLEAIATLAGAGLLLRVAVGDFLTLRIPNRDVLVLLALAVTASALRADPGLWPDLAVGLLLFALGFVLWLVRAMGAGDAKLYLPLGILVGWQAVAVYALALIPATLLLIVFVRAGRRWLAEGTIRARLEVFARTRAYPYAVPMVLAALVALAWRWA